MRSKLDEIVDEEILPEQDHSSAVDFMYRYQVMRAVERAFRHGAEMATRSVREASKVQPAPAEERCSCGCNEVIGPDGFRHDRRKDPGWIRRNGRRSGDPRTNDKGHIVNADRRKGQRRKEDNWPMNWVHEVGVNAGGRPIYQHSPHGAWYYDSRSGSDRRATKTRAGTAEGF